MKVIDRNGLLLEGAVVKQKLTLYEKLERYKWLLLILFGLMVMFMGFSLLLVLRKLESREVVQSRYLVVANRSLEAQNKAMQAKLVSMEGILKRQEDTIAQKNIENYFLQQRTNQQSVFLLQNQDQYAKMFRMYDRRIGDQRHILDSMSTTLQTTLSMLSDSAFASRLRDVTLNNHKGYYEQKSKYFDFKATLTPDSLIVNPLVHLKDFRIVDAVVNEKVRGVFNKQVSRNIEVTIATTNPHVEPAKQVFEVPYEFKKEKLSRPKSVRHKTGKRPKKDKNKMIPGWFGQG